MLRNTKASVVGAVNRVKAAFSLWTLVARLFFFSCLATLAMYTATEVVPGSDECYIRRTYVSRVQGTTPNTMMSSGITSINTDSYRSDVYSWPLQIMSPNRTSAFLQVPASSALINTEFIDDVAKCRKTDTACTMRHGIPEVIASTLPAAMVKYFNAHPAEVINDLAPGYVRLLSNRAHGQIPENMFPNIARCVWFPDSLYPEDTTASPTIDEEDATTAWKDIGFISKSSARISTCTRSGILQYNDVTGNYVTSVRPFSSVHIMYLLAALLWVSSAFALHYVIRELEKIGSIEHTWITALNTVVVLWNIIYVILTIVWCSSDDSDIPINNVVIVLFILFLTTIDQYSNDNDVMSTRCMEYAITTPLLFVITLAATSSAAPIFAYQTIALTLVASHLISRIALSFKSYIIKGSSDTAKHSEASKTICYSSLMLCSLFLSAAAFTIFMNYTTTKSDSYIAKHTSLYGSAAILVSVEVLAGLVILLAIIWTKPDVRDDEDDVSESTMQDLTQQTFVASYVSMDFIAKVVCASITVATFAENRIPAHSCSPWASF
jgi:hypothetical protein